MTTKDSEIAEERRKLATVWGDRADEIEEGSLLCSPTEAIDRINAYREVGADEINISLRAPWNEEALDAYLTEVIPAIRAK